MDTAAPLTHIRVMRPDGTLVTTLACPPDRLSRAVAREVLSGAAYRCPPLLSGSAGTILDVGANIGAATAFFRVQYPDSRIICYEPSRVTFSLLKRNVGHLPNVECFPVGLGNDTLTTKLYHGVQSCATASIVPNRLTEEDFEQVELVPANQEIRRLGLDRISILKIDTEGCEVPIIQNLADCLQRTETVIVEYHSENDRRVIDELLGPTHSLYFSAASAVHRGTCGYLLNSLIASSNALAANAIERTELATIRSVQ